MRYHRWNRTEASRDDLHTRRKSHRLASKNRFQGGGILAGSIPTLLVPATNFGGSFSWASDQSLGTSQQLAWQLRSTRSLRRNYPPNATPTEALALLEGISQFKYAYQHGADHNLYTVRERYQDVNKSACRRVAQ